MKKIFFFGAIVLTLLIFGQQAKADIVNPQPTAAQQKVIDQNKLSDQAVKFTPEVSLPGVYDKTVDINNSSIGTYIRAIFIYFIWVVGILATVMVTYGGIRWVMAAGNPSQIKDARDTVNSALIGLIIALTSYTLLYVINPKLLNLSLPDINGVQSQHLADVVVRDVCPLDSVVRCGELQETGTTTILDRTTLKQKEVKTYCAGVSCPAGDIAGLQHPQVCAIHTDSKTGYYVPDGCVSAVNLKTPIPEKFGSFTSVAVNFNRLVHVACGAIQNNPTDNSGNPWSVGFVCPKSKADPLLQSQCYLLGNKAIVRLSPLATVASPDTIPNLCCPGDACIDSGT